MMREYHVQFCEGLGLKCPGLLTIMGMMINILGISVAGLIIWWFLITKPRAQSVLNDKENSLDIIVENGVYEPALIRAKVGQTLQLRFLRKDKFPCAEVVIFDKLNISAQLPINKYYVIKLNLTKPGEVEFTCEMGMYRGKLIVE